MLVLPDGATLTSGSDQISVGSIQGGSSATVGWTVLFEKNGTHNLQVHVSGSDSNGGACKASQSTSITLGEVATPPFEPLYPVLAAIAITVIVIASAFMLAKRRRS